VTLYLRPKTVWSSMIETSHLRRSFAGFDICSHQAIPHHNAHNQDKALDVCTAYNSYC